MRPNRKKVFLDLINFNYNFPIKFSLKRNTE